MIPTQASNYGGRDANRLLNNPSAQQVPQAGTLTEKSKEHTMKEITPFLERMTNKLDKKLRNDNLDAQFSENDHSDQAWMDYIP